MKKFDNILEAICSFPSLVLEAITNSARMIWVQEEIIIREGEFDEEETE